MENEWGNKYLLVAIGASTGGPGVLRKILSELPADFPAPVTIVQHMPKEFTKSFAEGLNEICKLTVCEAGVREILKPGFVYIAPGDKHIIIKDIGEQLILKQNDEPECSGHRPSVDKMFFSISKISYLPVKTIAVILTGMGKDGAEGMKSLHDAGSYTIAQSEASCVIFGMPGVAVKYNAVDKILDLDDIPSEIIKKLKEK